MGIAERREREKEALRTLIVEAARDIVSEQGLDALSMRAIAERVEYSPATLYLYFRDKGELLREVMQAGFNRLGEYMREQLALAGQDASAAERHRCLGRAYARFALDNTAYFRVMFELPTASRVECAADCGDGDAIVRDEASWRAVVDTVQCGIDAGMYHLASAERGAVISWGLIHGLTSLFLSGHLATVASSRDEFLELVEGAMASLGTGWAPSETRAQPGP